MLSSQTEADRPLTPVDRARFALVVAALGLVALAAEASCAPVPGALELRDEFGATAAAPKVDDWTPTFLAQLDIISKMHDAFPDVDAKISWQPCGTINAWYHPDTHDITLCTELASYPGMAIFAAAHEFGHAIAIQRFDDEDEQSADSLAALAMLSFGYENEAVQAGLWFRHQYLYHIPGDTHPAARFRSWFLLCMEEGWESEQETSGRFSQSTSACSLLYSGMDVYWTQRLLLGGNKPKK